jgi:PTS system mannose-specific IIA component
MTPCLVVTHADLGRELLRAAEGIAGPVPGLACLSNDGRSLVELVAAIEQWLDRALASSATVIVLVDDRCGSCNQAVQLACQGNPRVGALAGVNLAMLLAYASADASLPLDGLVKKLLTAGTTAVQAMELDRPAPDPSPGAAGSGSPHPEG